jgi:hypothetical protein
VSGFGGGSWLIPGTAECSNTSEIAAGPLKFDAYCLRQREQGETMNIRYPVSGRAMAIQDFLMVTAFGTWALVLGLSPVLVFHALT